MPILDEQGRAVGPSDANAVASGRYPLRIAVKCIVHPQANEAARQFGRWLLTPQAAKAIEDGRRNETRWPIPQCPWFVHVTQAQGPPNPRPVPPRASP